MASPIEHSDRPPATGESGLLARFRDALSIGQEPERIPMALLNVLTATITALLLIGMVDFAVTRDALSAVMPAVTAALLGWTVVMRLTKRPQPVPILVVAATASAAYQVGSALLGFTDEISNAAPMALLMMTGALTMIAGSRFRTTALAYIGFLVVGSVVAMRWAGDADSIALVSSPLTALTAVLALYAAVRIVRQTMDVGAIRYEGLLETAPVAVVELDLSNVMRRDSRLPVARVRHINGEGRRVLRFEAEGGSIDPRSHPVAAPLIELARQVVTSGSDKGSQVIEAGRPGGRDYLVSWRVLDPSFHRVIFSGVDITVQQQAERALSEQVKARDQFIATVSHELRTPLSATLGFLELVNDGTVLDDERDEVLELALSQARDMAHIVQDLLVAARASSGRLVIKPEIVDVSRLVSETLGGVGDFTLQLAAGLEAEADPVRVKQILRNLVTNAQRYGGPAKRMVVRAGAGSVLVEMRDDGDALPEDFRKQMFEPYERTTVTDLPTESVGLGLTVARTLARMMDGDLTYHHDGRESIFRLRLPRHIGHAPPG